MWPLRPAIFWAIHILSDLIISSLPTQTGSPWLTVIVEGVS